MNKLWIKTAVLPLFGFAAFALSQTAAADWESGACPRPHNGPAPCIEYDDGTNLYHFNGSGGHSPDYHGAPGGGEMEFCGTTILCCEVFGSPIELECNLCLTGLVNKAPDGSGGWQVGIEVTGGTVSPGDDGCNDISLGGFPWHASNNGAHSGHSASTGVPYTVGAGSYTGSIGDTIAVTYLGFVPLVSGGHIHDVSFVNGSPSYFDFDGTLYQGGSAHNSPYNCEVDGNLEITDGDNITIL